MSKKNYRTLPVIKKDDAYALEDSFMRNLEKISVQPRKNNITEEIYNIMNGAKKSKYSSVEAAVNDMKERSGLLAYQNKIKALANKILLASQNIKLFEENPSIQNSFDNYIEDTKGNMEIPAVLDRIRSIHKYDVSNDNLWEDDNLLKYINNKIIEVKQKYPTDNSVYNNLGKIPQFSDKDIDKSNNDMMAFLMPDKS